MANTTNFGWETPDDTDLVKDGAAAMRTLGNSIDASFVDLKGGTTGQILSKNSNTDLDFTWIANDQGDITAVTAGTGISGGGTSGAVTITNSMATEITASGDIIVGTGSGTFDNLPIGTTGQVLTADTTVSPYKVKWAAAPTGGMTSLATGSLSGASVVISSIPTGYIDLVLYVTDFLPATDASNLDMRLNGDSANKYDFGAGGTDIASRSYASNDRLRVSGASDNAVADGIVKVTFFDYSNTNILKYGNSIAYVANATTSTNFNYNTFYLAYNSSSAISSITLFPSSGNFTSGSYVLYGVK